MKVRDLIEILIYTLATAAAIVVQVYPIFWAWAHTKTFIGFILATLLIEGILFWSMLGIGHLIVKLRRASASSRREH